MAAVAPLTAEAKNAKTSRSTTAEISALALTVIIMLCMGWTAWIMMLTLYPTATINRVMGTQNLDSGLFWLIREPDVGLARTGAAGLVCVELGYLFVLYRLWGVHSCRQKQSNPRVGDMQLEGPTPSQIAQPSHSGDAGCTRQYMYVVLKSADFGIQLLYLIQLMERGIAVKIMALFGFSVGLNAAVSGWIMMRSRGEIGKLQQLSDAMFDLIAALVNPAAMLLYSLFVFSFDKNLIAINTRVYPNGFFERNGAVVADPVQVTNIRQTLNTLRIDSTFKFFTCVGTNLALCHRLDELAKLLRVSRSRFEQYPNTYSAKWRWFGAFFILLGFSAIGFTGESVRTSTNACRPHPECVQFAHRWVLGLRDNDLSRCPCLAMIDRELFVKSYEEWQSPRDRTLKLAQLAKSGDLRTVQLVNRRLEYFPDEFRRCKHLNHVSLYYTNTEVIPDWFAEFTELEFLLVEGKYPSSSLQQLPHRMFEHMRQLTFLHLGCHNLTTLPSFQGLSSVSFLTLACFPRLLQLPSLEPLQKLEYLTLLVIVRVPTVPGLIHSSNLKTFVTADCGQFCCNGFLGSDRCNLDQSFCRQHPIFRSPGATRCLTAEQAAPPSTVAIFDDFRLTACVGEAFKPGQIKAIPTKDEVDQCDGKLYRECVIPGHKGSAMCYNTRWMAVACDPSPFSIEMRREQIMQGIGQPCDPVEEAWLGCS